MLSSKFKASSSDAGLTSDATCDIMTVPNRVGDHDALGVGVAFICVQNWQDITPAVLRSQMTCPCYKYLGNNVCLVFTRDLSRIIVVGELTAEKNQYRLKVKSLY